MTTFLVSIIQSVHSKELSRKHDQKGHLQPIQGGGGGERIQDPDIKLYIILYIFVNETKQEVQC